MLNGRRSKGLWVAALLPLFAASVLPTRIRTLVCRFTVAIMQLETCCPSDLEAKTPPIPQLLVPTASEGDPGWYENPSGTVATTAAAADLHRDGVDVEHPPRAEDDSTA